MENWYVNNSLITYEEKVRLTKYYKECGFVSYNEVNVFAAVD